jgi:hypothetical protein
MTNWLLGLEKGGNHDGMEAEDGGESGGRDKRRQISSTSGSAASFCARLSCKTATTKSITLLRGRLGRRRLAFLSLRIVFDQLFHVLGVGVVIFGRIEFGRQALDKLQGKIDFVRHELFIDRQAELISRADFRGETELIL